MLEVMGATGFGRDLAGLICHYAPVPRRLHYCGSCNSRVNSSDSFCSSCYYSICNSSCPDLRLQNEGGIDAYLVERFNPIVLTAEEMKKRRKNDQCKLKKLHDAPKKRDAFVVCCPYCGDISDVLKPGINIYDFRRKTNLVRVCPVEKRYVSLIVVTFSRQKDIRDKYVRNN